MFLNSLFKIKPKKSIITVLDIGSSKICCLVSEINPQGEAKVLGVGHQISVGFKNGKVIDLKGIENSIIRAIETAEKMAGVSVNKVILTFSGGGIKSCVVKAGVKLMGGVEEYDLSNVVRHAVSKIDRDKYEILHYFPLEYRIDDANGVKNPMGIYAETLSATLSLVTIPSANLFNIINCLARCHLDVEDVIASPYSSLYSVLTEEELEIGVTLIDIGHTTTSYLMFRDNQLLHIGDVALGGFHITSDIAKVLSTNYQTAERIKILHSSAVSSYTDAHKMIDIPVMESGDLDSRDLESISCESLNQIVAARVDEIFETVKARIISAAPDETIYRRIVLSGGTSQLIDIRTPATKILGGKVRIAKPKTPDGLLKDNRVIFYSSAIGCLDHYVRKYISKSQIETNILNKKSLAQKAISWIKEYI